MPPRAAARPKPPQTAESTVWTFLSNHAHVLVCLTRWPDCRLRDVAERVGITERAVQRIVAELEAAGFLERARDGRRNTYRLRLHEPLRHPLERHVEIGELLALLEPPEEPGPRAGSARLAARRRGAASAAVAGMARPRR